MFLKFFIFEHYINFPAVVDSSRFNKSLFSVQYEWLDVFYSKFSTSAAAVFQALLHKCCVYMHFSEGSNYSCIVYCPELCILQSRNGIHSSQTIHDIVHLYLFIFNIFLFLMAVSMQFLGNSASRVCSFSVPPCGPYMGVLMAGAGRSKALIPLPLSPSAFLSKDSMTSAALRIEHNKNIILASAAGWQDLQIMPPLLI